MQKVKIYVLIDPITNIVMYVGRTKVKLSTRMAMHYHCARHYNSPRDKWIKSLRDNNLKPIHKIIEDIDENIWREKEIYWIAYYKKINPNLTNLSSGGEGASGCKRSEESILSMSEIKSKPVYQLDLNFKILSKFKSCKEAERKTKINNININTAARSKGTKSAGGFIWIYERDFENWNDSTKGDSYKRDVSHLTNSVTQYDLKGNIIKEWKSLKEAAEKLKISARGISKCKIGYRKTYKKFIWK